MLAQSQIVSSVPSSFSVKFPSAYSGFLSFLGFSNLDFGWIPFGCVLDIDPYTQLSCATLTSFAVVTVLFYLHVRSRAKDEKPYFFMLLNFMYIILPWCSSLAVVVFQCDYFVDDDVSYMVADYSIICEKEGEKSGRRIFWEAYAYLMILIFPLGIPLLFAGLLYQRRHDLCPKLKERGISYLFIRQHDWGQEVEVSEVTEQRCAHLRFLVEIYEPHCFWFEIVESWRRLMLSSLLILIDDSLIQVMVAIYICLLAIKVYSYYEPYVDDDDDKLGEVSQWQLLCIFFTVLFITLKGSSTQNDGSLGYFLIGVNAIGFAFFFMILHRIWRQSHKEAIEQRQKALTKTNAVVPVLDDTKGVRMHPQENLWSLESPAGEGDESPAASDDSDVEFGERNGKESSISYAERVALFDATYSFTHGTTLQEWLQSRNPRPQSGGNIEGEITEAPRSFDLA